MDQGLDSQSVPMSQPFDKSRILNAKPLRCLVPIFLSPPGPGMPSVSPPQSAPFMCAPPNGPLPPGLASFYPFFLPTEPQSLAADENLQTPSGVSNSAVPCGFNNSVQSPVPITSIRAPMPHASGAVNGGTGQSRHSRDRTAGIQTQPQGAVADEDGYGDSQNQSDQYLNSFNMHATDAVDTSRAGRRRRNSQKRTKSDQATPDVDIDLVANKFLTSFNLTGFDTISQADGDSELVRNVLMIYNLLRKRITQAEDVKEATSGMARRPDLKSGAILMNKGIRTNSSKRVGAVPGVEVGDIFFFRMEMCLVGLHAPSMAGIDYMSLKVRQDEDPMAVSVVSSGGYEDDAEGEDVLIYSGQGGTNRKDKHTTDQKLERGNLALEKSLRRGNEVRVIRGMKDVANQSGKIYLYDGLYKVQDSWIEKGKSGCSVFKYKLARAPGQSEAFRMWKTIQQWKEGMTSRVGVILPDLTSGAENLPVSLVNDVDDEKGPDYFTYFPSLKYSKPVLSLQSSSRCTCKDGCQSGVNCPCIQKNGGALPYTSLGVLLSYKSLIYECGASCTCPPTCRNRISHTGFKVHLEVFRTKNRGWGLRSLDPIRSGNFICEFAGEVVTKSMGGEFLIENEDNYIFDATRTYEPRELMPENCDESLKIPFPLVISAKTGGNVARFMNHSCTPNVYWQPVIRESNNGSCVHIAFFAINHIPPMKELTYDYGTVQSGKAEQRKKKCLCGSSKCRGHFH